VPFPDSAYISASSRRFCCEAGCAPLLLPEMPSHSQNGSLQLFLPLVRCLSPDPLARLAESRLSIALLHSPGTQRTFRVLPFPCSFRELQSRMDSYENFLRLLMGKCLDLPVRATAKMSRFKLSRYGSSQPLNRYVTPQECMEYPVPTIPAPVIFSSPRL